LAADGIKHGAGIHESAGWLDTFETRTKRERRRKKKKLIERI
jgi:hypothetical protein